MKRGGVVKKKRPVWRLKYMKVQYNIHLVHLWSTLCRETKGGEGAREEEERREGWAMREVDGKGGRDHIVFPFKIALMV